MDLIKTMPAEFKHEMDLILAEGDMLMVRGRFPGHGLRAPWIVVGIRIEVGRLKEDWDVVEDEATRAQSVSGLPCSTPPSPDDNVVGLHRAHHIHEKDSIHTVRSLGRPRHRRKCASAAISPNNLSPGKRPSTPGARAPAAIDLPGQRTGRDRHHRSDVDRGSGRVAEGVSVLINNAGTFNAGSLPDGDPADFRSDVETHYFGTPSVTGAFAPSLAANEHSADQRDHRPADSWSAGR